MVLFGVVAVEVTSYVWVWLWLVVGPEAFGLVSRGGVDVDEFYGCVLDVDND